MADDLANAARILSRAASRLASSSSAESSPSFSSRAPEATSRTDDELRTLFPHHFTSSSRRWENPGTSSRSSRKRRRAGAQIPKCKEITRKFICLADKEQSETPDSEEHRELLMAGLGEAKIAVPEESSEKDVRELLIKTFPKLKDAGGFELMYVETRKRELRLIPPGLNGLPMKYLVSFVGQGKIFVRPIQQDLLLESSEPPTKVIQKETCRKCLATLDVNAMREHYSVCSKMDGMYCFDE